MKKLLFAVGCILALLGTAAWIIHQTNPATGRGAPPTSETKTETAGGSPTIETVRDPVNALPAAPRPASIKPRTNVPIRPAARTNTASRESTVPIHPRFEALLDPMTSFETKQSILRELAQSGHLDAGITELERRARDVGQDPTVLATLGRAYLEKSGTLQDVREQGVLGLKADQVFEQALAADASNWDARYWKAMAMSFWPPQLGKTSEVTENLLALIQQQEASVVRPEFVRSYILLGEQYQRSGYDDYARQMWQRGLTVFPNDRTLQERLAAAR